MRIGILSDLHHELPPRPPRRWINSYDGDNMPARMRTALAAFEEAGVDLVLLLGDLTETGDERALEEVLAACAGRPVAAVGGNHDGAGLADTLARHGVEQPAARPVGAVAGVAVEPVEPGAAEYRTLRVGESAPDGVVVAASHFPLLSQRERLAAAGLPYPGDLVDREETLARFAATGRPVVALSGHIHTRCSQADGTVLQLTVGALIEPPFDATVVEIEPTQVTRSARRLGPRASVDPVLAPDRERWTWSGEGWARA